MATETDGRVSIRGPILHAARVATLLTATAFTIVGWRLLDSGWHNFDTTLRWYGASVFLLAVAAMPRLDATAPRRWRERVRDLLVTHRWELVGVSVVLALGAFMRLYEFDYFPPSDGVAFEEVQTGGIAYAILEYGERPVEFAVTNYTASLGFASFGRDVTALRIPFLLAGILSVATLYVLLRLMVAAPAALFATALFAVNRWHAFSSRIADETFLGSSLALLAAVLLVTVLRTGSPLALLGLGLAAGGLTYEYTSYRHVPFLIVAALALGVILWSGRELLVRRRRFVEFLGVVGRKWWLAPTFAIALAMAVSPLVISSLHGNRVFVEAFQRHEAEQALTGPLGLLPEAWPTRLKWVTEVLLPWGPRTYPESTPLNLPGEALLDPVTASLALVAIAYVMATLHRPYRLFFAVWLLAGLFVGAVIPTRFLIAKFTGLLPALFVLIAFLVGDVVRGLPRRLPRIALPMVLLPLLVWAFVVNLEVLSRQADDPRVRGEFLNPLVDLCIFATDLGPDFDVYTWSDTSPTEGLFGRSDYEWVCGDMEGRALNSMLEVWPPDAGPHRPVALVYLNVSNPEPDLFRYLVQGYPTIAVPSKVKSRSGSYTLRAITLPLSAIVRQQGLYGTYFSNAVGDSTGSTRRIDPAGLFLDGMQIEWPAGTDRVRWEGLVLLRQGGEVAVVPRPELPVEVRVDGQLVYQPGGSGPPASLIDLEAGWHLLQVQMARTGAARAPTLAWVSADTEVPVAQSDLFAVSPVRGWAHVRSVQVGEDARSWQRIDPYPSFGWDRVTLPDWLVEDASPPAPSSGQVLRDEWTAVWQVPVTGRYTLELSTRSGAALLLVDGKPVLSPQAAPNQSATDDEEVLLGAGEHRIHLYYAHNATAQAGVRLEISGASGDVGYFEPF